MWRSILAATLLSSYGHPVFDGYRPEMFDRALQAFYADVQKVALDGKQTLRSVDERRIMGYVRVFTDRFQAEVRTSGLKLPESKTPDNKADSNAAAVTAIDW